MKKLIAVFMAVLMLFSFSTVSFAAQVPDDNILQPQWDYMSSITLLLNFTQDKTGVSTVVVNPYAGITTGITGTITVYEMVGIDWVYVDSKTQSSETLSLGFEVRFPATSGVMYKAVFDVTASGADGSESDSVKRIRTCP